nr:unnamed protein product [Spirometra erinaceieuropaei]
MRDIVTLPANKGRSTVVMDKTENTAKLEGLLEDEVAYKLSETGKFKKHMNRTGDTEWTVKLAKQFLRSIRHLEIEPDKMMVSFDVVSLLTSIQTDLAISTLNELLQEKYGENYQRLKLPHVIELLELCLRTFFIFSNRVYEQKKGTPMGSPLSILIAEAVLQKLERLVFRASYEAPASSDGADSTGEQIAALSTVVTFPAVGESQPAVRRPTRVIDPPTRPNSRPRFPYATAADRPVKLRGEGPRAHGPSSDNSGRAGGRGHTSAPAVDHGET